MKPGLYLKEAPEIIIKVICYHCTAFFQDGWEYTEHMRIKHGRIYVYKRYDYNHLDYPVYHKNWLDVEEDTGLMRAPWKTRPRPFKRYNVTEQEMKNRNDGKCHCGKPKSEWEKGRRKYCGATCASDWWDRTTGVGQHKDAFLYKHNKCEACKKPAVPTVGNEHGLEMDHIIAIIFGGHPWDERNLQALCPNCHKAKTKSDIRILTWWKRESNYDNQILTRKHSSSHSRKH